jgi:catalase
LLLPVNQPKGVKAKNYQRDGYMRFDGNNGDAPNYYPNSFGGPEPDVEASEPVFDVAGKAVRQRYTHPNDDFVQPGNLYRLMTEIDRDHLIGNILSHLGNANKEIQLRELQIFSKADPEYGQRVAEGLGIKL